MEEHDINRTDNHLISDLRQIIEQGRRQVYISIQRHVSSIVTQIVPPKKVVCVPLLKGV